MREMTLKEVAQNTDRLVEDAQRERVLLMRDGKPVAIVIGVQDTRYDAEDWSYMLDPDFWKMIEERRAQPTVPWEQVKAEALARFKR
jgi:antitoxin (DNA-binding transcriptional repressor) of toxin-antitoxin stability system